VLDAGSLGIELGCARNYQRGDEIHVGCTQRCPHGRGGTGV